MENKIHIVNWLLTRKCNLNCSYCAITKNYKNKPAEYPNMKYYIENEMSTEYIIEGLKKLKKHNPDCFHIFYGGEPFLRSDLPEIINYCNKKNIHYTIITNNSPGIQDSIETLLSSVDYIQGLTSSIDPLYKDKNTDQSKKSYYGMSQLISLRPYIKDLVAEMTISNENVKYLYQTVKELSEHNINTDITFIDISKSPYYDFSNITDKNLLVHNSDILKEQLQLIRNDKLDAHMLGIHMDKVLEILPSNLDCKIENNLHNITIDADGSIRLCLRIRGVNTPKYIKLNNRLFDKNMQIIQFAKSSIILDKIKFCRKCNWTCMGMSNLISKGKSNINELAHLEKRRK